MESLPLDYQGSPAVIYKKTQITNCENGTGTTLQTLQVSSDNKGRLGMTVGFPSGSVAKNPPAVQEIWV